MNCIQLKALMIKNLNLLSKQKSTLICQIITPVLCLSLVYLIKFLVETNIDKTTYGMKMNFPFIFNIPVYQRTRQAWLPIRITNCNEWYLYDFDQNITKEDIEFFGSNPGDLSYVELQEAGKVTLADSDVGVNEAYNAFSDDNNEQAEHQFIERMLTSNQESQTLNNFWTSTKNLKTKSSGMLTSQKNVAQKYCERTFKLTPYFERSLYQEPAEAGNNLNSDLYERLKSLNQIEYTFLQVEYGINSVPDGAILVRKANSKEFEYRLQVNDNRFHFYHRNNAVTKYRIFNDSSQEYSYFLSIVNGAVWLADLMNKAYTKNFHPNLSVISGIQLMPFELNSSENIERTISLVGSFFYPIAVSLLMPLFMYTIVLEKESRLVEIMKINGMKMRNYWLSIFIINFLVFVCTYLLFIFFGFFVFKFTLFVSTSILIQMIVLLGWGLAQIGLAFFFQAFLSNARTSTSKFDK